jgi:hypothetical protein
MTTLDEQRNAFEKKLQNMRDSHKENLDNDLAAMRTRLIKETPAVASIPEKITRWLSSLDIARGPAATAGIPQARLEMGTSAPLREVDSFFQKEFQTRTYLSSSLMAYPTVFCESLEEFFGVLIKDLNVSPTARQAELNRMVEEARQTAEKTNGGGIFGVNLPGQGCYLNGWLFAYGSGMAPAQVKDNPEYLPNILMTAAHEKLGHGFLAECSALGSAKSRLGLTLVDVAQRFGMRAADDPLSSLRQQQNNLIFTTSQLVEEGWATWVESYLGNRLYQKQHPHHAGEALVKACQNLPADLENREEIHNTLLAALVFLLGDEPADVYRLHWAVDVVNTLGAELDDYFFGTVGQPLRYCVGELLYWRIEIQLGALCVPYAALIAANVAIDIDKISLSDLQTVMGNDPRLHPDARLAAIARLGSREKNNIPGMARMVEQQLSFSVPPQFLR